MTKGLDAAREAMERAFELMGRHDFEPTPAYVMAWYAYATGENRWLVRRIDHFIENRDTLPKDRLDEIICQFFIGQAECHRLFLDVNGVDSAIGGVLKELGMSETQIAEFCRSLEDTAKRMDGAGSIDEARRLVTDAVGIVHAVVARQKKLVRALQEASEEVAVLRNRLEDAYRQAVTDDLTGLKNRRFFDARLRELVDEAEQTGCGLVLVLFDIDHFKSFNDEHGHQTGDNVLKLVAGIIRSATRESDVAARVGGEEFGLILRRIDAKAAYTLAERIRATLATRNLVSRGSSAPLGRITISGGLCEYAKGMGADSFFARADQVLYRAKREGRNRVLS